MAAHKENVVSHKTVPAHTTVGRLSLTPATKTTVVTTTTTTTVSYPPFVMNAPKDLSQRDPEMYPLAARPTPPSLRKLRFELGGESACFVESQDAEQDSEPKSPRNSRRSSQHKHSHKALFAKPVNPSNSTESKSSRHSSSKTEYDALDSLRNQSATPVSLSDDQDSPFVDAVESDSFVQKHIEGNGVEATKSKPHAISTDNGVADNVSDLDISRPSHTLMEPPAFHNSNRLAGLSARAAEWRDANAATLSVDDQDARPFTGSSTPPQQEFDNQPLDPLAESTHAVESRPTDTSSGQEVSLPSPSLSPITAAAQMHKSLPSSRLRDTDYLNSAQSYDSRPPAQRPLQIQTPTEPATQAIATPLTPPLSLDGIPAMLDSFDMMPEALQSYVMYQLLRRCSKHTIVVASRAMAPALQVDFFKRLPLELSQQIVRSLDRQSMCRAAQVSKKWRQVVDSDERAWQDLIHADGFRLAPGEIEQAIREGWGWQFPINGSALDLDLSRSRVLDTVSEGDLDIHGSIHGDHDGSDTLKKRKRDISPTSAVSVKRMKRRAGALEDGSSHNWINSLGSGHGPNAFATMAAIAVPYPAVGLPSLQQLHLFKSIYRRHFLVRRGWLDPETKARHIAFKAHEGHVVTCLQFDSEKILTGSDDAIIDIYDTSTGARLKRLTGHEGGVWALEYQDNILVSGSTDRSVRIWNMDDGRCLHVFQGHTSTVRCLQIVQPVKIGTRVDGRPILMPPQRLIITGSRDSNCRIWKLPRLGDRSVFQAAPSAAELDNNPYFVRALTGHTHSVRAIAAHADTLVSGSYDGTVRVWQISTGETVHRLSGHTTKVYSVVLDHERKRCISGSMDTIVKVWSTETGECLFNLSGHQSLVGLLDLKDDILVSAAADFTLKVWDPETGQIQHTLKAHTGAITCFAHDGHKVISGSERTLKMWNIKTGEYIKDLMTDLRGVWQVRFDERRCIAAVHRGDWTYIEILDFGAAWDGWAESDCGRRVVVDKNGVEVPGEAEEEDDDEEGEEGDAMPNPLDADD